MDIINRLKDYIKSYCNINVIDITNSYYKYDKCYIKKYWTLLLVDYDHSKIFFSEKNKYYTKYDDDNESVYLKILNDFNSFV